MDETPDSSVHSSWSSVLTDPVRLAVLRALCELGTTTIANLKVTCHTSDPTVRRHLEALEAFGLVREEPGERDGLTPGRPPRRFTLDSDAAARVCVLFDLLSEPLVPTPAPDLLPPLGR
jgi:predicted ArsR family transcriptional regulator